MGGCDLRPLCEPQPLRGADGTPGAHSPGPVAYATGREKERIAAGIAAAIMVGTVFLSGSRGGMIAIFVELVVFAVILRGCVHAHVKKAVRIAVMRGALRSCSSAC